MNNLWQKLTASSLTKTILPIVLTLGIVGFLLTQISVTDVVNVFSNLSYDWIALGAFLYLINNVGRALRLRVLLPNQSVPFYRLLLVVIIHTMFSNILPAKTGEFSLLYFLKKYETVSLDKSSAALVITRIMDYLATATIFIIVTWFSLGQFSNALLATDVMIVVLGLMALAIIALVSLVWWGERILTLFQWLAKRLGVLSSPLVGFILKILENVTEAFAAVRSFKRYFLAFLWSLCLWMTMFVRFYVLMRGIGLETKLLNTVIGSTFAVLSRSIPLITLGGIGTHEAGWTVGFMLVGFSKTQAITSGFAVNILTLLISIMLGMCCLWILRVEAPAKLARPVEQLSIKRP